MRTNQRAGMIYRGIILAFLVAGFAGCVKTGSGSNSTNNNISFITLMNMAPYTGATEVYFNGIKQTSSVSAGSYSSNYGQIPTGSYDVQFKVSGADSLLSEIPSSIYDSLEFYTLILYNTADGQARSMKINDDFSTLSTSSANYRFFQLSPDAPAIDLYFNSSNTQPGRTLADNVNSGGYFNQFQALTPGVYTIQARKAGTDSVVATTSSVTLAAGSPYTIFLQGSGKSTTNPISLKILLASY